MSQLAVVQGFGPFTEFPVNPSELLVRSVADRPRPEVIDGAEGLEVVTEVFDVSKQRVTAGVRQLMEEHRPDIWLGVGLAAGRTSVAVEAVAVNLADWPEEFADVDGVSVTREQLVDTGPAAYTTTLPVGRILDGWKAAGIPGYLSLTAGSYLCNLSFYAAAQAAADLGLSCMVGFLHVPLLPELVTKPERQPSMAMSLQVAAVDCVLEACRTSTDEAGLYPRRTA